MVCALNNQMLRRRKGVGDGRRAVPPADVLVLGSEGKEKQGTARSRRVGIPYANCSERYFTPTPDHLRRTPMVDTSVYCE